MALAALWPDLAKFRHFGKILDIFGDFWGFGKKFNLLWHILNAIGQIFIVVQGQISKIHTAIWSHCLAAFVTVFESEQKSWLVHIIADTNLIEDGSACFYKIRLNRNNNIFGSWWRSSGQRACLLLRRFEFESRWRLQFFM